MTEMTLLQDNKDVKWVLYNSDVVIKVTDIEENFSDEYVFITTLRNVVKQVASRVVNIYNYIFQSGFEIEIVRVQLPDAGEIQISSFLGDRAENQSKRPFAELGAAKQIEKIFILLTSLSTNQSDSELAVNLTFNPVAVARHHFSEALADFREAILRAGHKLLCI